MNDPELCTTPELPGSHFRKTLVLRAHRFIILCEKVEGVHHGKYILAIILGYLIGNFATPMWQES